MDDIRIIELLFARSETALIEIQKKYGKYCHAISMNILGDENDCEECVNDTYMKIWQSIPPERPICFSVFIGRISRNLSLNRLNFNKAKRRNTENDLVFEELSQAIPDPKGENAVFDEVFFKNTLNSFLKKLPARERKIFVQRYWYMMSVKDIASFHGITENLANVSLSRMRKNLKEYLEKEGVDL
jgi:RNA polymerase sigma-70 factor (ECF subfamily)